MFTEREFSEKSKQIYYAVIRKHQLEDTEENRFLFHRGFYLGAHYAMETSTELSPHIARFIEFVMWLSETDPQTEVGVNNAKDLSDNQQGIR